MFHTIIIMTLSDQNSKERSIFSLTLWNEAVLCTLEWWWICVNLYLCDTI